MQIEKAIQRQLILWCKRDFPDVKIIATQNENSRKDGAMLELGLPDLILFKRSDDILQVFFLELKRKKGTLQKVQKEWSEKFKATFAGENTKYAVAYGFEHAKEEILEWLK